MLRRLLICKVQCHRQFMQPKWRQGVLHVTKLTFVHKVSLQHYSTCAATGRYANQKLVIDQGTHSASNCKEVYGVPNRLDSSGQIGMASQKIRVWVNKLFQHALHKPTGKKPPFLSPRSTLSLPLVYGLNH